MISDHESLALIDQQGSLPSPVRKNIRETCGGSKMSTLCGQMRVFLIILMCWNSAGCVFYPKQVEHYDFECKIKYKKLVLEQGELNNLRVNCSNEGCIALLLLIPLEALVAGSIVVVGNTVYWLEKEGRCLRNSD